MALRYLPAAPSLDTLGGIRARPGLIENAVRTALVDAMTWRLGGGATPAESAFGFAAVAAARQEQSRSRVGPLRRTDATALGRAAAAAAIRLFRAPLGKRLMTLPREQIVRATGTGHGADVVIRDADGHLHLIALTALSSPLEVSARAHDVARQTHIAPRDRLSPVRLHLYSLRTGVRHEFGDVGNTRTGATRTAYRRARVG